MNWIKMSERKPDVGQKCFTYFGIIGVEVAEYYHPEPIPGIEGTENEDCFTNESGFLCGDVTHWMPYVDGSEMPNAPSMEVAE